MHPGRLMRTYTVMKMKAKAVLTGAIQMDPSRVKLLLIPGMTSVGFGAITTSSYARCSLVWRNRTTYLSKLKLPMADPGNRASLTTLSTHQAQLTSMRRIMYVLPLTFRVNRIADTSAYASGGTPFLSQRPTPLPRTTPKCIRRKTCMI